MPTDDQKRTGFSRRDFIKGAAIAAGGTVLGGTAAGAATAAGRDGAWKCTGLARKRTVGV